MANFTTVIRASFELLQEKKIPRFDQITVRQLVFGTSETLSMLQQRPKIVGGATASSIDGVVDTIARLNSGMDLDLEQLALPIDEEGMRPFRALGISALLSVQGIAYKMLSGATFHSNLFIAYETGQGKTALCLAVAVAKAQRGESVIVVNQSPELTFRDYKKSLIVTKELPISIRHLELGGELIQAGGGVVYASAENFIQACAKHSNQSLEMVTIVLDEFDSYLFKGGTDQEASFRCLLKFPRVLGVSGSDFQVQHQQFIESYCRGRLVNLCIRDYIKSETVCRSVYATDKKANFLSQIVNVTMHQTNLTPVILIMDQWHDQTSKQLMANKVRAENLASKDAPSIEAIMSTFTLKSLERYGVFIINQEQGRGLDFHSHSQIEQGGGVYLIIGCIPPNFLAFRQFVGRTGRIGNLGQYSVILYHKDSKNIDCTEFFKLKIEELKNKDIQSVSQLAHNLSASRLENNKVCSEQQLQWQQIHGTKPAEEQKIGQFAPGSIQLGQEALDCIETITDEMADPCEANPAHMGEDVSEVLSTPELLEGSRRKIKEHAKQVQASTRIGRSRDKKRVDRDLIYFDSYSMPEIHREMTQDDVRMNAFETAIKATAKDCFVVDIGAGSGVLCVMAAQAGASKVIGVEYSDYFKIAQESIKDNALEKVVEIVQQRAEEFILFDEKADILISEWMGYFLIFENMLPSVLAAKAMSLREGGRIIPRRAKIMLAAFDKPEAINGIVLKSLEKMTNSNASIEILLPERILTSQATILDIDLETLSDWQNAFTSSFELISVRSGQVKGLVGWFDAELTEEVTLTTSPQHPPTHWKQTLFYFQQEIIIEEGQKLVGNIAVQPIPDDHRGLQFELDVKVEGMKRPFKYIYWLQ